MAVAAVANCKDDYDSLVSLFFIKKTILNASNDHKMLINW